MTSLSLWPWVRSQRTPSIAEIAESVAVERGLTIEQLRCCSRHNPKEIVAARDEAMTITFDTGLYSYARISRFYGYRDHSGAFYAIRDQARRKEIPPRPSRLAKRAHAL